MLPAAGSKWVQLILAPGLTYPSTWGFADSTYVLDYYHATYQGTPFMYGMGWGASLWSAAQDPIENAARHRTNRASFLLPYCFGTISLTQLIDNRYEHEKAGISG